MDKKLITRITFRFFENNFPKEVRQRFAKWFIQPEQSEEKEEALKEIWESLPVTLDFDSYTELRKINRRIQSNTRSLYQRWVVAAVIIALPLLGFLSTVAYHIYSKSAQEVQMLECFVPNGERRHITLPDGSTVWLNTNSVLIYPEKFGKTRTLFLSGEGHFTVAKDKERPFIVKTNYLNVEALGTVFNVHSYPEENTTTTILESGRVRIGDKIGSSGSVILSPNEQLVYNHTDASFVRSKIDASRLTAWTKGYLNFQQETMKNIFRVLERQYNVRIICDDTKFDHTTFTVRFNVKESLEEILSVLQKIGISFTYKRIGNDVYIK